MYSCDGNQYPLVYHCKRKERFNNELLNDESADPCYDRGNRSCESYISARDRVCIECQILS